MLGWIKQEVVSVILFIATWHKTRIHNCPTIFSMMGGGVLLLTRDLVHIPIANSVSVSPKQESQDLAMCTSTMYCEVSLLY